MFELVPRSPTILEFSHALVVEKAADLLPLQLKCRLAVDSPHRRCSVLQHCNTSITDSTRCSHGQRLPVCLPDIDTVGWMFSSVNCCGVVLSHVNSQP